MGGGAFLAASAADAVLLSNRPQDLGFAVRHAARAIRRVKQNFALAFAYNLIVIPLAAMAQRHSTLGSRHGHVGELGDGWSMTRLAFVADDSRAGRAA